jgi:hypothetical protein
MPSFPTPRRILLEVLPPSPHEKLVLHKNIVMHQLFTVTKTPTANPQVIAALALEAALLEDKIADGHVELGKPEEAAINLISAASCWVQAHKKTDALRALDRARELSQKPAVHRWIKNYTKQVEAMPQLL